MTHRVNIPKDLIKEIIDYSTEHYYVLLDWIDETKLNIKYLCKNPMAGDYIKELLGMSKKIFDIIDKTKLSPILTTDIDFLTSKNKLLSTIINCIITKLDWYALSANPSAIKILQDFPTKINWYALSSNPAAINMLREKIIEYPDGGIDGENVYVSWEEIAKNEGAIDIIKEYSDRIDFEDLSRNPAAYDFIEECLDTANELKKQLNKLGTNPTKKMLLDDLDYEGSLNWEIIFDFHRDPVRLSKKYPHRINWDSISFNKNAIELIKENPHRINWDFLMQNEAAIDIIKETLLTNPEKIKWEYLCRNKMAIDIIKDILIINPEKINWNNLCKNKNAMDILKENQSHINWDILSENYAIFKSIRDDIIKKTMNLIC